MNSAPRGAADAARWRRPGDNKQFQQRGYTPPDERGRSGPGATSPWFTPGADAQRPSGATSPWFTPGADAQRPSGTPSPWYTPPDERGRSGPSGASQWYSPSAPTAWNPPSIPTVNVPAGQQAAAAPAWIPAATNGWDISNIQDWDNNNRREAYLAYMSAMVPYQQQMQNASQYAQDFNEMQRRWEVENAWRMGQDTYNMGLSTRQQEMAEWQAQEMARQAAANLSYNEWATGENNRTALQQAQMGAYGRWQRPNARFARW